MKFLVRERIFDIGEDYWVEDEEGNRVFHIDGKALRLRKTFELQDADGNELYRIREKLLAVRDTMTISRDGEPVAKVRERVFDPIREKLVVELASGGEWTVTGDFLGKEYTISDGHGPIAIVSRTWFRLRDTYAVDVNTHRSDAGGDVALVLSVAVCVEALADGGRE